MKKKVFIILFCLLFIGMAIAVMLFVKKESEKSTMKDNGAETIIDDAEETETIDAPQLDVTAYDALIEIYRTAILEEWDMEQQHEAGIGLEYHHDFSGAGYDILDINMDGIAEMVVGEGDVVTAIYTLVDDEPELLFGEGIRHRVLLYEDGIIEVNGVFSIPRGEEGRSFSILKNNGEVELVDGYIFSRSEEVYKDLKTGEAPTTEEAENELQAYMKDLDEKYKEPVQPLYKAFMEE